MNICALLYQAKENLAIAASTKKPKPAKRGLKEKYVLLLKNVFYSHQMFTFTLTLTLFIFAQ